MGLAAAAAATVVAAPAAVLASPAKPTPGPFKRPTVPPSKQIEAATKAMKKVGDAAVSADEAARRFKACADLYISPEAMEDIRNWGCDQVDEQTRREIMLHYDNGLVSKGTLLGVNMVESTPNDEENPYAAHMQDWEISVKLDREEVRELGRPKHVSIPVEAKDAEYRAVATRGPLVCSAWGYDVEGEPKEEDKPFTKRLFNLTKKVAGWDRG